MCGSKIARFSETTKENLYIRELKKVTYNLELKYFILIKNR